MRSASPVQLDMPLRSEDSRFLKLHTRLLPYGGLLSGHDVQCLHAASRSERALGEALLRREVMALKWHQRLWWPMFQFQLPAWEPLGPVSAVVTCLFPVMQGFELVEWFLTANAWLSNRLPVDVLTEAPLQVLHAAQADRFLITF